MTGAGGVVVRCLDPEPNGLATLLCGLIEQNLARHPERARFLSPPATVAVEAPDVGVAASLRFSPGLVRVRNGVVGRPQVHVRADSQALVGMAAVPTRFGLPDLRSPEGRALLRRLLRREVRVKGMVLHAPTLARLNRLLAVS
ncbi:MAG TPA: hypothetical protein VNO34_03410 [Actinomycetota bacterium]|nr:hypothetical protein [Actinomycetota bacterium]